VQRAVSAAKEVAAELETTPARVALAWVLRQGLIPVIGARTAAQERDNLGALAIRLDDAQLGRLDAATRVTPGYPHGFLRERSAALSPPPA
jgi:aryl-alcohol dehydrogenase-like predicted oxidoreductase